MPVSGWATMKAVEHGPERPLQAQGQGDVKASMAAPNTLRPKMGVRSRDHSNCGGSAAGASSAASVAAAFR